MSLCAPTSNSVVRIHITSCRICAKSFRDLEVSASNRSSTFQEQKHNIYLFADVRLCQYLPIAWDRSRNLPPPVEARITPALKLVHFFPFDTSRLSKSSSHFGRTRCKVKIPFTVILLQQFLVALTHANHSPMKKTIPLMLALILLKQKKRGVLNCFNFRLCGSVCFTVHVFHHQVVRKSQVTK